MVGIVRPNRRCTRRRPGERSADSTESCAAPRVSASPLSPVSCRGEAERPDSTLAFVGEPLQLFGPVLHHANCCPFRQRGAADVVDAFAIRRDVEGLARCVDEFLGDERRAPRTGLDAWCDRHTAGIDGVPVPVKKLVRQAEVENFHGAVRPQLDVGWLQVAVDDALLVRGLHSFGNLPRDGQRSVKRHRLCAMRSASVGPSTNSRTRAPSSTP